MWHSITMRGCDRTSPFPLHSLRAISDIASLLLRNAVYFTCLHWWIPFFVGPPALELDQCEPNRILALLSQ